MIHQTDLDDKMMNALYEGNHHDAMQAIQQGANVNADMGFGITPLLHVALTMDAPETIRFLQKNGANLKQVDRHGNSALHLAATAGHSGNVACLQSFRLDPSLTNINGKKAIDLVSPHNPTLRDDLQHYAQSYTPERLCQTVKNQVRQAVQSWQRNRPLIKPIPRQSTKIAPLTDIIFMTHLCRNSRKKALVFVLFQRFDKG